MEDSSSPSSLRVWPRSRRTVRNARCRRERAHRICRTRQLHAARHIVPARVHPSPRGRVRTPCRLPRAVACATRAQASLPPCPVAPLAPVTRAPAAPFGISAGVKYAGCPGLRAPCALGLAPLLAATLAQAVIRHGPGLSASWTHAAGEAFGGNAFITPPPARTFFIRVFVWHVPPFRGRNPGEGRPARLRRLRPAEHLRGQAA